MVQCKCCAKTISENAQACPYCGEPNPAPDPPAPTLVGVLRAAGINRPTLLAGLVVFCGVGLATWGYHEYRDRAAARAIQEKAAVEKAAGDEEFVRRLIQQRDREARISTPWRREGSSHPGK
jgi:hypothetical protein